MSPSRSQDATTDDFEVSDVAPSPNSQAQVSQTPISPTSSSNLPASPSPALQPLALSPSPSPALEEAPAPAAQLSPARDPPPDELSAVSTPQNSLLQEYDPAVRASEPPTNPKDSGNRTTSHGLYKLSLSPWVWEMASLLISIGLLVAMIIILGQASNRPEQDWDLPITLSALVNTLSTVYRALLAYVAVEVINQEKWIWLWSTSSQLRPLRHIQYFEAGSRGLLGALKLMPLVAKSSPTSFLALVVVVLSLAVGPFAQQSINTVYRPTESGTASLPVSYWLAGSPKDFYFRTLDGGDLIEWSLKTSVRSALFSALANPSSNDSVIPVDCPTRNCEFPRWGLQGDSESEYVTHASVGMCTRCHDVSSLVSTPKGNLSSVYYSLPNGMQLMAPDSYAWLSFKSKGDLSWAESVIPVDMAAQVRWSFTNTTVLTMGPAADQDKTVASMKPSVPVAVTCSLYPCLRTYSASIRDGRLLEKELHSTPLYPDVGDYNGSDVNSQLLDQTLVQPQSRITLAAIQSPCRIENTIFATENMSSATGAAPVRILDPKNSPSYPTILAPNDCTFRMNSSAYLLLREVYSKEFLEGNCSWNSRQGFEVGCRESWWLAEFWESKTASVQSVKDRFSAIADAATNQFRLGVGRQANSTEKVYGVALEDIGYTVFRWQWFLLPTLLLVIDAFLLGWMLYRSIRHRNEEIPWKGNLLPLLYYRSLFEGADGGPLEAQAEFNVGKEAEGQLLTATELEDASKQVFVRLRRGKVQLADEV